MRQALLLISILFSISVSSYDGVISGITIYDNCNNSPYGDCGALWRANGSFTTNYPGGDGIVINNQLLSGYKPYWGIGAALTESSGYLMDQLQNANPSTYSRVIQETEVFTSFRIPIGTSDFAVAEWTFVSNSTDWDMTSFNIENDKYSRPLLNAILQSRANAGKVRPVTLFFSVWTPPIWLKTNSAWEYEQLAQLTNTYYQGVANYILKFISELPNYIQSGNQHVVQKIYISIQNEPFQSPGSNLPGCSLSVNDQIQIINFVNAGNFNNYNLGNLPLPEILVLDHNWDIENDAEQIMRGVSAAGVAFHAYGGTYTAQQTFRNNFPNSEIHMTEFSGSYTDEPLGTLGWDSANIIFGSLGLYGQSVTYWNLMLNDAGGPTNPETPGYCTSCNGVFRLTSGNSVVYKQPRYFTLGLPSSCIPYGASRLQTSFTSGSMGNSLSVMAFKGPSPDPNGLSEYCLLISNTSSNEETIYVQFNNQYLPITLDASDMTSVFFTA